MTPASSTAAPSFSPAGGTYSSGQTVAISTATSGALIRYTLDGSTPSETAGDALQWANNDRELDHHQRHRL
jgi:hypothetical protein